MPAPKSLHGHWEEDHASQPTALTILGHLFLKSPFEVIVWCFSCHIDPSRPKIVHHSNVQGCIPALRPFWNGIICWPSFRPRDESPLLYWDPSKPELLCCVEDGISEVPDSSLPLISIRDCVIPLGVAVLLTY